MDEDESPNSMKNRDSFNTSDRELSDDRKPQLPDPAGEHTAKVLSHDQYFIGWVCALPLELAAAQGMLDETHEPLPQPSNDSNTYTLGRMAHQNVVIACLPAGAYGTNNAATVATHMRRTFPSISLWFLVGIGGGVPDKVDIRLGDVVVSDGVIQHDFGKIEQSGFRRTSTSRVPQQALMTAVSKLKAVQELSASKLSIFHQEMLSRYPTSRSQYADPGPDSDRLFESDYEHNPKLINCESCDKSKLVMRDARSSRDPRVHYGIVASANSVIKHGGTRHRLTHDLDTVCFEMEAAGLMESLSCLVVRGIADYSDSHKHKRYQRYAAATAAAYAKELLSVMPLLDD